MRPDLRLYGRLFRAGFRRRSSYRLAMVAGVLTNSVFGAIRGVVLGALVLASGGAVAGYTATTISTYNWLTQGLLGPVNVWGDGELAERVRTGDIAVDLARPVDLQLTGLAYDLGMACAAFLPRTLPTVLVGALTFGIALPRTPTPWLLGLVSLALALALSYLCRFAVQLIAFWLVDIRGVLTLYQALSGLLAGLVVPIALMPDWLAGIALATPFPGMLQFPVDILSGYADLAGSLQRIAAQAGWILGIGLLGRVLLRAGSTRLVIQGG